MCDDTAVRWSEASAYRSNIEYEIRNDIAEKLLQALKNAQNSGYPEVYLQGLDKAIVIVKNTSAPSDTPQQEHLF